MAGKVRNDDMSSLPPNYVSLAQLRDIWMKKQEEKKLQEKEEEERKQAAEKRKQEEELRKQEEEKRKQEEELRKQEEEKRKQEEEKRNDGRRKTGSGYARIEARGRVSKMGLIDEQGKGTEEKRNDGRRIMGSGYERRIDEKGKGKELTIGGYGVVEGYKKWNNSHFREMESAGDERNRNEVEKEKIRVENRVNNGPEMVPINGGRGGIPNEERMKFRGGFRKNRENRGPNGRSRNEHGDRLNQVKQNEGTSDFRAGMLDDEEKKGERGRNNGGYLSRDNRLKESRVAVLKGKGVEPEMVKKGEDEIVEALGESSGLRGRRRNEYKGRNGKHRGRYNKFKESRDAVLIGNELKLETEKKAEDAILEGFNEKCCLNKGDRHDEEKRKETNEVKVEGEGSSDDRVPLESKVGDGVLTVESVKNGEKEKVRNGRNRKGNFGKRGYNRFKESRDTVLIGDKLELETEKKVDDEILEVINENRAEGEGSSDDRVAVESKVGDGILTVENKVDEGVLTMESKVDDGVLMVGNVKNGEEGARYEHRRHENWRRHFGERRYIRVGRYNDRQSMKRGSGMMWVKKEVKSRADSGTSGVQYIESN